MYLSRLTDQSIIDLHGVIKDACLAAHPSISGAPRDYSAWRVHADAYETEMTARAVAFEPIDWR